MADYYVKLPVTGGAGGVTTLNSLSGALTLVAGSNIIITDNGTDAITIATTGGTSTFPLLAPTGAPSAPQYSFAADQDTGMYLISDGLLAFSANGVERLRIDPSIITASLPISTSNVVYPSQASSTFLKAAVGGGVPSFQTIATGELTSAMIAFPFLVPLTGDETILTIESDSDTGISFPSDGLMNTRNNNVTTMRWAPGLVESVVDFSAPNITSGNLTTTNFLTVNNDVTVTGNLTVNTINGGAYPPAPPTGAANTFAGFDNTGALTSNFGWNYDDISHGLRMSSTYDPILGNATTNNFDVAFNPSADSANSFLGMNIINRYDTGAGNFSSSRFDGASVDQEHIVGNGALDGMRAFFTNQQAGNGGNTGSITQLTNVDLATSIGAGFVVQDYLGQSIRLNQSATITQDALMLDISTGGTAPVVSRNLGGINLNFQTDVGQDLHMLSASNSHTVGQNSLGFTYFDSGDSGGFIGLIINKGGNTTDPTRIMRGLEVTVAGDSAQDKAGASFYMGTGTVAGNMQILSIDGGSGTVGGSATAINININSVISPVPKIAISSSGGSLNVNYQISTATTTLSPFGSVHNLGGQLTIANGFPLLASPLFLNNFGFQIDFEDDVTADNFLGTGNSLGQSIMAFVNQVAGATGKTFDTLNYVFLGGSNVDAGTGHINELNIYRGVGLLNAGGGLTADSQRVFYVDPGFDGAIGTNKWGFINASSSNNWMKGSMVIGGSTGTPVNSFALDVSGAAGFNSGIANYSNGTTSIDTNNRSLITNSGVAVLDWSSQYLTDTSTNPSLNWGQRFFIDATGSNSIDYNNRQMLEADGTTVSIDWSNGLKLNTATSGVATLIGGTATVSTAAVVANSIIILTSQADGGVVGFVRITARTVATSFTITSSSVLDTSNVGWVIIQQ